MKDRRTKMHLAIWKRQLNNNNKKNVTEFICTLNYFDSNKENIFVRFYFILKGHFVLYSFPKVKWGQKTDRQTDTNRLLAGRQNSKCKPLENKHK